MFTRWDTLPRGYLWPHCFSSYSEGANKQSTSPHDQKETYHVSACATQDTSEFNAFPPLSTRLLTCLMTFRLVCILIMFNIYLQCTRILFCKITFTKIQKTIFNWHFKLSKNLHAFLHEFYLHEYLIYKSIINVYNKLGLVHVFKFYLWILFLSFVHDLQQEFL